MNLYTVNMLSEGMPTSPLMRNLDQHVTDTRVIADMLGRSHPNVIRSVRNLVKLSEDPEWDLSQRIHIDGHRTPATLFRDGLSEEARSASNGDKLVYVMTKGVLAYIVSRYGWPIDPDEVFRDAATPDSTTLPDPVRSWERRADFLARVPYLASPDPRRPLTQEHTGLSSAGVVTKTWLADRSKAHKRVFLALRRLDAACGIPTFEVFKSHIDDPLGMRPADGADGDGGGHGDPANPPTASSSSYTPQATAPVGRTPPVVWGVRFALRAWPGRPVDPAAFARFVASLEALLASEQSAASVHAAEKRIAMAERAASRDAGRKYGEQKAAVEAAVARERAAIEGEIAVSASGSLVSLTPLADQDGNPPRLGNPFDQVPPLMVRGFPEEWQARLAADRMLAVAAETLLGAVPDPKVFPVIPVSDATLLALLPPEALAGRRIHPAGEVEMCVDMRVPHALIGVSTPYAVWVKARIARHGLVEGRDYAFVKNPAKGNIGKPREDYYVRHPAAAAVLSDYAGRLERGEPTRRGPTGPRNRPLPPASALRVPEPLHGVLRGGPSMSGPVLDGQDSARLARHLREDGPDPAAVEALRKGKVALATLAGAVPAVPAEAAPLHGTDVPKGALRPEPLALAALLDDDF